MVSVLLCISKAGVLAIYFARTPAHFNDIFNYATTNSKFPLSLTSLPTSTPPVSRAAFQVKP